MLKGRREERYVHGKGRREYINSIREEVNEEEKRTKKTEVRAHTHTHTHTRTHTHTHSCLFATAAFKAVMTGQRVIRDSEWRGHYSCSPLPANNCNYPNSTLTTIDLSLSRRPRSHHPSSPEPECVSPGVCLSLSLLADRVAAECVPLSPRVVHTCRR